MKKTELIELLKMKKEATYKIGKDLKDVGLDEEAKFYKGEWCAYSDVLNLLGKGE